MRLIDADALTQLLQTCADDKWNKNTSAGTWSNAYYEMILHVEDMPSAEPEIVRCKDCKFAHLTYTGECKYCDIWWPDDALYMDGDHFCASAERKGGA